MNEQLKKINWVQIVSYVVILFLLVKMIVLILQNRELKSTINRLTIPNTSESLKEGEKVEPFGVQTLDSSISQIRYDDTTKKYLFFVFSTTCPYCEKNIESWNSIVKSHHSDEWRILGISTHSFEPTMKYYEMNKIYYIGVCADTNFTRKYKVYGVPQTLMISGDGTVKKVYNGLLNQNQVDEIESMIGAKSTF
jgi:peroxiredoxin